MASPFRCYVIGDESLAIQCADILLDRGHTVLGVISSDEGIAKWAEQKKIACIAPSPLSGLAERMRAHDADFDWLFSIANLTIIPDDVLALPRRGAINFHDGPLPFSRSRSARPLPGVISGMRLPSAHRAMPSSVAAIPSTVWPRSSRMSAHWIASDSLPIT